MNVQIFGYKKSEIFNFWYRENASLISKLETVKHCYFNTKQPSHIKMKIGKIQKMMLYFCC